MKYYIHKDLLNAIKEAKPHEVIIYDEAKPSKNREYAFKILRKILKKEIKKVKIIGDLYAR